MTGDLIGQLDGQALASGIFKDLPHAEPPLWANGQNVYFSDQSVQPIPGQYVLASSQTGVPIKGVKAAVSSGVRGLVYGTVEKLYRYTETGGAVEVGTGYGDGDVNTSHLWSIVPWSDWILATNGVNAPQIWKGSSFAALAGIGSQFTTLDFFIPFGEYMLGISGKQIFFCARSNVENWVPAATNAAGSLSPQDLDGPFKGGIMLDQRVVLFTMNSMHLVEYIGPPNYFGISKVENSCGIYGINCIVAHDKKAYGHGPNGFFVTDGTSHIYIDEGVCHDDVFNNKEETSMGKSLVWHSKFSKLINFWWPTSGSKENSKGWSYNYVNNTWAPRSDARTCGEEQGIFPWGIIGDASGGIYAENNVGNPVNVQDGVLPITEAGQMSMGFGQGGFGLGGFGGVLALTP